MKKVVIFGAGVLGESIYNKIVAETNIVAFWDNFREGSYKNIPIEKPNNKRTFDKIYLATVHSEVRKQLVDMGIPEDKLDASYVENPLLIRNNWLTNYSQLILSKNIKGNVAEAGVYRGEFAKHINACFPDRKCYLFDTFEGFSKTDVDIEKKHGLSIAENGQFGDTSEEIVMDKMPHPEMVEIVKGFFPKTAIEQNIEDKFCFVNLDMDLYQPTLEGLRYFHKKMVRHGVILVHDYFTYYTGIEKAVNEFLEESREYSSIPIGDETSIAIVGFGMKNL